MGSVRLLRNGIEAFPAMLEAIDGARSSVLLEIYIFNDDATGTAFMERLAAAARRGVEVMLLIDGWGSWAAPDRFLDELVAAGGKARRFRPLRRGIFHFRDHRKLLLVDDELAFIGGLNIGDEYRTGVAGEPPWRDNLLEIRGQGGAWLHRRFLRMWRRAAMPYRPHLPAWRTDSRSWLWEGEQVRFLASGPGDAVRPVRSAYLDLIHGARAHIDLAMAYFLPRGRVLRALKQAARRGVRVRLILPARTDVAITRWAAHGLYGRLLRWGVEIWEYRPGNLHAKLAITDDTIVAGSANLDQRSERMNYELVVAVTDRELAAMARSRFEADLSQSDRVSLAEWRRRPLGQKIKEWISFFILARIDVFLSRLEIMRRTR